MGSKAELINQSQYAKRRGVSREAVRKAIQDGRITLIDGKIDPAVADIQWEQNTNPAQRRSNPQLFSNAGVPAGIDPDVPPEASVYNLATARAKREHFDAQMAEMRALRESGELVSASAVAASLTTATAQLRTALEMLPDKLAARIAAETDSGVVYDMLASEIAIVLNAATVGLAELAAPQPAMGDSHD